VTSQRLQLAVFLAARPSMLSTLRFPPSFITMRSLSIKLPELENTPAKLDE
jgi:hypothetical protein